MTLWVIVAAVVVALILAVWIGNAYRLAKKNRNLIRRSTGPYGEGSRGTRRDPQTGEPDQGL